MTPADRTPQHASPHPGDPPRPPRRSPRRRPGALHVLEREVERLSVRVEQLEREKARLEAFAAVAAHELVEPLVMTEAYVSILLDRLTEPEHADSRRDLHALGRGVSRTRTLAESLLHDARSSGRELEPAPVDVTALVADCLALLAPEIAARDARIELGELPGVVAEEALLGGVFSNLLINALKYSPRQGAGIRVGGVREQAACRFFVESEGPAIPREDRERIFGLYERGQGERRASGAGLGLAICRRSVERHGGEIGVDALDGGGNRFFFTLPA